MKPTQLDAIEAWAIAALKGTAQHKTLRAKLDKTRPAPPFSHFKLDALERRIAELAWAVERSLAAAQLARARSDGSGLTVELVRATLKDRAVDAALSLKRTLRRHALITVGDGGAPAATGLVRLAPGLAARLDGAAEPDALWPGISRLVPGGRGDVPVRVTVVLDDLDPRVATILTLDGCGRRDAHDLAAGLARRAGRGVLLIDGELAAAAPSPWLLASCARREADLDGDALLVCQAAALGENWRALIVPAVDAEASRGGQGAVPLIVLADSGHTRDPLPAPFLVRRLSLHAPAVASAASAPSSEPVAEPKAAPIDDGLDHVRQMAIRDAERALGIFRPSPPPQSKPLASPLPNAPTARTPAQQAQSQTSNATQTSATPASAAPNAPAGKVTASSASAQENARAQLKQSQADQAAKAPPTAPDERKGELPVDREEARALMMQRRAAAKAEKEAQARAAGRAALAGEDSARGGEAASPSPASEAASAPATVATAAAPPLPPDGPPLPLPADPALEDLVRACGTSPSSAQRIEIIGKFRGIKHAAVVAALRANAASAHPGVRAAAESAMAALFGPNWNVSRPMAKPIQAPPSDDKDRGPPGGW